ncbi:branched-chain amino acid ABC transporter permease [Arthrobacter mobilis]|uniref:Branched-chain amino acid ABC transporter permease n=1 Tax=Arthrobacter mobilis TaxID=2724944 RepID=A0A7X6HGP9_9MICC|nr:branched-chain amino acid ABC transporter permease [Arthrobacter mobilis]NKX55904.1 branched-chain amino acid ABC transporter permease [Arthrobacter mobilis]
MNDVISLLISGLGLAGIYFLLASGLSLIYGLMRVLNLAHGAIFAVGGFVGWAALEYLPVEPDWLRFTAALVLATLAGAMLGILIEKGLLARLYGRPYAQMLLTLGLAFAMTAFLGGWLGHDPLTLKQPAWFDEVTVIAGSRVVNSRLVIVGIALILFLATVVFLRRSKHGLIIRAGVNNRSMVMALGINVSKSFTLLFVIGSGLAGLGGVLAGVFFGSVTPELGTQQLIFAFIVIIVGGLGSLEGTALAALVVAVLQQFVNYYGPPGAGDLVTVLLLAVMLLVRPRGLLGKVAA